MSFLVWCLSIVIDGRASSDQLLGLMLVKVCCVSCLCLIWVSCVGWRHIGLLCCVCVAYNVCVVLRLSSVFLVFLLCDNGRKGHHSYFITTVVVRLGLHTVHIMPYIVWWLMVYMVCIFSTVLEPVKTLVLRYNTSVSNLCSEVKTCEHIKLLL